MPKSVQKAVRETMIGKFRKCMVLRAKVIRKPPRRLLVKTKKCRCQKYAPKREPKATGTKATRHPTCPSTGNIKTVPTVVHIKQNPTAKMATGQKWEKRPMIPAGIRELAKCTK